MRSNLEGAIISNCTILNGNRQGVLSQTLTATFAVPPDAPHTLLLDPGGAARNVTLPANPQVGDWYEIWNTADAAEVITVQTSAGGALTPAITPTQSEVAKVIYTGATLGWRGAVSIGV